VGNHVAMNIKLSQYFFRTAQGNRTPCYRLFMLYLPIWVSLHVFVFQVSLVKLFVTLQNQLNLLSFSRF